MANNRRVGREYALKMLFALQLDSEQYEPKQLIATFWHDYQFADDALGEPVENGDEPVTTAARLYAETIVHGVIEFRAVIDRHLNEIAKNWTLARMSPVDLTILRVGTYELLYLPDVPVPVVIDEAIEIAKRYGTKESPAFINGLLDKIAKNSKRKVVTDKL